MELGEGDKNGTKKMLPVQKAVCGLPSPMVHLGI